MICTFECTFCRDCVTNTLANVCPNCGGGFAPRPIRPAVDRVGGNYLGNHPARTSPVRHPVDLTTQAALIDELASVPPERR